MVPPDSGFLDPENHENKAVHVSFQKLGVAAANLILVVNKVENGSKTTTNKKMSVAKMTDAFPIVPL